MSALDYVKSSPLFAGLSNIEMKALANVLSIRSVKKGRILFMDGDKATGFYVLFKGKVRIYKSNPEPL